MEIYYRGKKASIEKGTVTIDGHTGHYKVKIVPLVNDYGTDYGRRYQITVWGLGPLDGDEKYMVGKLFKSFLIGDHQGDDVWNQTHLSIMYV